MDIVILIMVAYVFPVSFGVAAYVAPKMRPMERFAWNPSLAAKAMRHGSTKSERQMASRALRSMAG